MAEHRQYVRHSITGKVLLHTKSVPCRSIQAELTDISLHGLGVYAREQIEEGTEVKFLITNENLGRSILGDGRVRYSKPFQRETGEAFRTGIEFTSVEQSSIQALIDSIHP
jgi:c-di-GMP-binding flagellar brake protein YcgR